MNPWPAPLVLRALGPAEIAAAGKTRGLFQVLEDFSFHSPSLGLLTVPAGFITDFASIPRPALWYLDGDDPAILFGSVIHDWLYVQAGTGQKPCSRAQADQVLREAMLTCGARRTQAAMVWAAVRLGGRGNW